MDAMSERHVATHRLERLTESLRDFGSKFTPHHRVLEIPNPITIEATYHGTASLGYIPGKRYQGNIVGNTFYPSDRAAQPCPYSVSGFVKLWSDITVIDS